MWTDTPFTNRESHAPTADPVICLRNAPRLGQITLWQCSMSRAQHAEVRVPACRPYASFVHVRYDEGRAHISVEGTRGTLRTLKDGVLLLAFAHSVPRSVPDEAVPAWLVTGKGGWCDGDRE